jgi:hypothetical protein
VLLTSIFTQKKEDLTLWSAPFRKGAVPFFGQVNKRQCEAIETNQTTTKSKAK